MDERAGSWIMVFCVLAAIMYDIEQYWLVGFCWAHAVIDIGMAVASWWYKWKARRHARETETNYGFSDAALASTARRMRRVFGVSGKPKVDEGDEVYMAASPVVCPDPVSCGCDGGKSDDNA